jgi:hypothetical protein
MDNLDHAVGNASADYRDEISVGNDGAGVDDGSWSLVVVCICSRFLLSRSSTSLLARVMRCDGGGQTGHSLPSLSSPSLPIAIATAKAAP